MTGKLLVAGGYGVVGRRIASLLAAHYPGRVVIGGRRPDAAQAAALAIGFGTQFRHIDVNRRDSVIAALDGVEVVVSCVDQLEPHLLRACAQNGLAYTDITPQLAFRSDIEDVDAQARQSGARILMGAGIAPRIMRKRDGGLMASLKRLSSGTDVFGIIVTAGGTAGSASLEVTGRHQADARASNAAEFCRALWDGCVQRAGVSFAEQVIDPQAFFDAIGRSGLRTQLVEGDDTTYPFDDAGRSIDDLQREEQHHVANS